MYIRMYYDKKKQQHRNHYSRVLSSFTSVCANETRNSLLPPTLLFRPTLWFPDLACSLYFRPIALIIWSPYITQVWPDWQKSFVFRTTKGDKLPTNRSLPTLWPFVFRTALNVQPNNRLNPSTKPQCSNGWKCTFLTKLVEHTHKANRDCSTSFESFHDQDSRTP